MFGFVKVMKSIFGFFREKIILFFCVIVVVLDWFERVGVLFWILLDNGCLFEFYWIMFINLNIIRYNGCVKEE